MTIKCPVCRAEISQGPVCRRCKADLSLLFALEERREALMARARESLAMGWRQEGLAEAREADGLRSDEESQQLVAVAALLAGDHAEAWRRYCQLKAL